MVLKKEENNSGSKGKIHGQKGFMEQQQQGFSDSTPRAVSDRPAKSLLNA